MRSVTTMVLAALLFWAAGERRALRAQGGGKAAPAKTEPAPTPFSKVVRAHFKHWDLDGDGKLTPEEIHKLMTRPKIKGEVAAAIATLRCIERYAYTREEKPMPPFTLEDLKRYEAAGPRVRVNQFGARGSDFDQYFKELHRRLKATPRQLFPEKNMPNPGAVYQGYLGDCFFMSMVGALVHLHPEKVRDMIKEAEGNKYTVAFPGWPAPCTVLAPTDAEIALNSTAEQNGLWLTVLEKAYARRVNLKVPKKDREKSITDAIAEGGYAADAVAALTGHATISVGANAPHFAQVLRKATEKRCLISTGLRDERDVPELHHPHVYAVIGFDGRQVTLYDSIALDFTPKGPPGPQNGFVMKKGVFSMPLEQFRYVFNGFQYEDLNTSAVEKKKKAKN